MKAFFIDRYGSKGGLLAGEMPDPELREDDVLVQIHAAGVNLLDAKIRDGEFKLILPYRLPLILGNDVAGVVVRVGSRVRRFKVGDEVYTRPDKDRIGTFAEFISMNEKDVAMKPKEASLGTDRHAPLDPPAHAEDRQRPVEPVGDHTFNRRAAAVAQKHGEHLARR
jgi:NADPH:quinone reductase-like Zn-dependent oxidoreductase